MTDSRIYENKTVILDKIPVKLDIDKVAERIKIRSGPGNDRVRALAQELIEIAGEKAVPKAVYRISKASNKGRNLIIDGVELKCWVPTLKFNGQEVVFPYVATCGTEIEGIIPKSDFLKHYIMNHIKEALLFSALEFLQNHLIETYSLKQLTHIGPGEALGPLAQLRDIFSIIGDVEGKIGVRLSESNLMIPEKSGAGVLFETEIKIERCRICPQGKCRARKAAYEPEILTTYRA